VKFSEHQPLNGVMWYMVFAFIIFLTLKMILTFFRGISLCFFRLVMFPARDKLRTMES
jgi:hypothetical protein